MIIQGADGVEGQIIKSKHLYRELNSSSIGRETLELIDQNNIDVVLSYGRPLSQKPGYTTFGVNYDNTAVAYVTNTVSKQKTASTIIHEVTHAAGTRGSQRAEVIAEIRALKHTQEASYSDIRSIIERVKIDYSDLPYRKYPVGQGNH